MRIKEKNYPYPVLTHYSEHVKGTFAGEARVENDADANTYRVHVRFSLNNAPIQRLIEEKRAAYVVHVESNYTKYRVIHRSFEEELTFDIDPNEFKRVLEFCYFVVSLEDMENYENDFSSAYEGIKEIEIDKGDILAVCEDEVFQFNEDVSDMSASSIFRFSVNPLGEELTYMLEEESIAVLMPENMHGKFRTLSHYGGNIERFLVSEVVKPIFTEVMYKVANGKLTEDHEGELWFEVIKNILKTNDIDIESGEEKGTVVGIVEQVLANISITNFDFLLHLLETQGDGDDED